MLAFFMRLPLGFKAKIMHQMTYIASPCGGNLNEKGAAIVLA